MDNPLTPSKILRLLHYAEDKSFNSTRRLSPIKEIRSNGSEQQHTPNGCTLECSSGILDLEKVEVFGESAPESMSINRSTSFNPGEMTGRSTGAEEVNSFTVSLGSTNEDLNKYGRHSSALDNLKNNLDKQTSEVNDIIRHSIASNYSFHSKRDLTADEVSFVKEKAPLPVQLNTQANITDMSVDNISMGSYFKNRCPEFSIILTKTDSPDRSMAPSITEVTSAIKSAEKEMNHTYEADQSLDCVPVRQPRTMQNEKAFNKEENSNMYMPHKNTKMDISDKTNLKIGQNSKPSQYNQHHMNLSSKPQEMHKGNQMSMVQKVLHQQYLQSYDSDQFLKKVQELSLQTPTEDTGISVDNDNENSLSISKIADYLGKQSNVSVTGILQLNKKKQITKKQPLTELQLNSQYDINVKQNSKITELKDIRKGETESSAGSINTVISLHELNPSIKKIPDITFQGTNNENEYIDVEKYKSKLRNINSPSSKFELLHSKGDAKNKPMRCKSPSSKSQSTFTLQENFTSFKSCKSPVHDSKEGNKTPSTRSKSPSSKSQSTLSTVQENFTSFKSSNSPLHNTKGEAIMSHILSPNAEYKELDKSVDWHEVLQQKHLTQESLAKEQWAEIKTTAVNGFVGVSYAVTICITTLVDNLLLGNIHFNDLPDDGRDLTIELPRRPFLLTPKNPENIKIYISSNVEMNSTLLFTISLQDSSLNREMNMMEKLNVIFKIPTVHTLSCDGMNKVVFPPTQETYCLTKHFVVISDDPIELQLDISVVEGDSMFTINNLQEIRRSDVGKILTDRHGIINNDQQKLGKSKGNMLQKQLCRLANGNAIKVPITFTAPKLSELDLLDSSATFKGEMNISLIGVNTVLKTVDLIAVVGTAKLVVDTADHKLHLSHETKSICLNNVGSVVGVWNIKIKPKSLNDANICFNVLPTSVEIPPGGVSELKVTYTGSDDVYSEAMLIMEDVRTNKKTVIELYGRTERPRTFPVKTNYSTMSWVRSGRKELSLKNSTNKKIQMRCQIIGEGFAIDLPGLETKGTYCVSFGPHDCRTLPIMFAPSSTTPHKAALHLVYDKNSNFSRKVKLFGCACGDSVRWSGLVTYGDTTALVRAAWRAPVLMTLYNKYSVPAFVSARVHFNLQYRCCEEGSRLEGGRRVIGSRSKHTLALRMEWSRVERRARDVAVSALATLTVLAGPELTRQRILRIIRNESTGELDTSMLPDHLKVLTENFEGENVTDNCLQDFDETKMSLNELIESLQELTAQIDLPQDLADENTIIISNDSLIEHHTLCN